MQPWFPDAKLGIFIHYGIYAVKGISESWSFFTKQVTHEDYMTQLDGFTASKYDPEAWADLFRLAGAKYAVLTTKHHDGVALWDTQANDLSVVNKTPAGRDLITPYVEALRKRDLKVGFYYSHLDWTHPDYATVFAARDENAGTNVDEAKLNANPFTAPADGIEKPERWENFLKFHRAQLRELSTQFGQVDLFWFDGQWERSNSQWRMHEVKDLLSELQPKAILNSRMLGYGDYRTPEQGLAVTPPEGPWEFCMTINDSWGYQVQDHNHKSVRQIVRIFAEVIGGGGNLLLDVGPYEDGSLQPEQVEVLKGLGEWTHKHAEAIYGTERGLPGGFFYGPSTLSKDKKTLNVFFFDKPFDQIAVRGLVNKATKCTLVGTGEELTFKVIGGAAWEGIPGTLWIDIPEHAVDPNATVVRIEFEDPLEVYTGTGAH